MIVYLVFQYTIHKEFLPTAELVGVFEEWMDARHFIQNQLLYLQRCKWVTLPPHRLHSHYTPPAVLEELLRYPNECVYELVSAGVRDLATSNQDACMECCVCLRG